VFNIFVVRSSCSDPIIVESPLRLDRLIVGGLLVV
jgi:hypothetical protein